MCNPRLFKTKTSHRSDPRASRVTKRRSKIEYSNGREEGCIRSKDPYHTAIGKDLSGGGGDKALP